MSTLREKNGFRCAATLSELIGVHDQMYSDLQACMFTFSGLTFLIDTLLATHEAIDAPKRNQFDPPYWVLHHILSRTLSFRKLFECIRTKELENGHSRFLSCGPAPFLDYRSAQTGLKQLQKWGVLLKIKNPNNEYGVIYGFGPGFFDALDLTRNRIKETWMKRSLMEGDYQTDINVVGGRVKKVIQYLELFYLWRQHETFPVLNYIAERTPITTQYVPFIQEVYEFHNREMAKTPGLLTLQHEEAYKKYRKLFFDQADWNNYYTSAREILLGFQSGKRGNSQIRVQ